MTNQQGADFEGEVVRPSQKPDAPAPTFGDVKVVVSRKVQAPDGERYVLVSVTARPAPGQPVTPLVDQLHRGLSGRLAHYFGEAAS
jgi:hypothetical protein